MTSLKKYIKGNRRALSKIQNGYDQAIDNKYFWYTFYNEYFENLICNIFEWRNLPESIDPFYIEKVLNREGKLAIINHKMLGFIAQRGTYGHGLDIYDNPTLFITDPRTLPTLGSNKYSINNYSDSLDPDRCFIIHNTFFDTPTTIYLHGFSTRLADIENAIQLNRNAQNRPYIILTDDENRQSMREMYNKVESGEPVIYARAQKSKDGLLDPMQLADRFMVLNTNTPFLLDKLHDEKQRVINQLLTFIGINNNAVDKAERLVAAEATANNGLISASIEMRLKARKKSIKLFNECFNLDIDVDLSERIHEFNIEKIYNDLDDNSSNNIDTFDDQEDI